MPSTTFTVSSGSERVVVYPERGSNSASSASVHSPVDSETRSFSSSAGSDGWTELQYDDGIEPSDSASRSRQPPSRRNTTEARPAPKRRHSSRRVDREREREESIPHRHSSHRHHSTHHRRRESRRTPSDESTSTVASDDYPPYGHYGMPQSRAQPPPLSGYRHVPPQSHGGYPPNMPTQPPYQDPYAAQALVPTQHYDPFGPPSNNPFTPQGMHGQQQNPFSPMSTAGQSSYFQGDPHMQNPMAPPPRPQPVRPQSFAAPSSYGGHELMAPYQHHPGMHPGMQPGMQPGMGYPGYQMQGMNPYQQMQYMYPPSHSASPQPPAAKKEDEAAEKSKKEVEDLKAMLKKQEEQSAEKSKGEIEALKDLIKKQEEQRLAREQAWIAKAEAEAAAVAAAKAKEEEAKIRAAEIAAASQKAREEAEKEASEKAAKAEEEHKKKMEEAKKAQEAVEKKQKELEEEVKKNKPHPDSLKAPIKFKDAVGRKFSFPWHLCKTWKGMENLIKQAFLHVDVIGMHVQEGHYDLCGPDGEIILPQVWDTMIQPDWEITMHMWPMPEPEPQPQMDKLAEDVAAAQLADPFAGLAFDAPIVGADGKVKKPKKDKKNKHKAASPDQVVDVGGFPPPPPMVGDFPGGLPDPLAGILPPGVMPVQEEKKRPKAKSKSSRDLPPLAAWIAGGSRKRK